MDLERIQRTLAYEVAADLAPDHGLPDVQTTYGGSYQIRPGRVLFRWAYDRERGRWDLTACTVSGPNVLKSGETGNRRGSRRFLVVRDQFRPTQYLEWDREAPAELRELAEAYRPEGSVLLP